MLIPALPRVLGRPTCVIGGGSFRARRAGGELFRTHRASKRTLVRVLGDEEHRWSERVAGRLPGVDGLRGTGPATNAGNTGNRSSKPGSGLPLQAPATSSCRRGISRPCGCYQPGSANRGASFRLPAGRLASPLH